MLIQNFLLKVLLLYKLENWYLNLRAIASVYRYPMRSKNQSECI